MSCRDTEARSVHQLPSRVAGGYAGTSSESERSCVRVRGGTRGRWQRLWLVVRQLLNNKPRHAKT